MKSKKLNCIKVFLLTIAIIISQGLITATIGQLNASHAMADIIALENKAPHNASAVQKLIEILSNDPSPSRRRQAAISIGNAKIKSANQALLKSLEMDDDVVRQEVILALGKIGVATNVYYVLQVWNNRSNKEAVRLKALESLSYFNNYQSVQILISMIKLNDGNYSTVANNAILNCKFPLAASQLMQILKNDDTNISIAAKSAALNQKSTYNDIMKILNKKINTSIYDAVFYLFVNLLVKENYSPAMDIFVKAFLLLPDSETQLKKKLLMAFKAANSSSVYVVVSSGSMNLRALPNTRSAIIGILEVGKIGKVLEITRIKYTIEDIVDHWYKVKSESGKIGWLFGGYLKKLDFKNLPIL